MSSYSYVLTVTDSNGLIETCYTCRDAGQHCERFTAECADRGVEPTEDNFEVGYMQLEDGTTISMVHAYPYAGDDREKAQATQDS